MLLGAGCASGKVAPPTRSPQRPGPPIAGARVAIVVLENHGPGDVLGSGWLATQARRGALATNAYGETHPSLGNYLAMISGSNQGVSDDDVSDGPFPAPTIAGQLDAAGVSWKAYMNGMPSPCFGRTSTNDVTGRYAKRHNPFLFFDEIIRDPAGCRAHVVPGAQLGRDIAGRALPRFVWITPDLCQDMHDCDVAAGNRWMASALPPLLRALGPRGVLFVTADEGTDGSRGGRIPLVALGRGVRPGAHVTTTVDHRNLLATIEDVLGLPRLRTTHGLATVRGLLRG